MLDDAHDDDRVEPLLRLVFQEVGKKNVEAITEIGELAPEIILRHLGNGDAGEVHARLQRMTGERAPTRADLEHLLAGSELALLDGPVEFALERLRQGLVVAFIHTLAVGGKDGVEEAQEQLGVGVVVRRDRLLVGIDLSKQQRLNEAPGGDEGVAIVEQLPEREGLQHVPFEVNVAAQIGLGNVAFVQGPDCAERALVAQADLELGLALAHLAPLAIRQLDGEGHRDAPHAIDEGVDCASG